MATAVSHSLTDLDPAGTLLIPRANQAREKPKGPYKCAKVLTMKT